MRRQRESQQPEKAHGASTLEVRGGTIVGIDGDDVFVELGPRMQGVISAREFGTEVPKLGDTHDFTLRGREEGLWVLAMRETPPLVRWEEMEVGLWTAVRLVRTREGGLAGKIGELHAFLPRSQSGLSREEPLELLVGKTLNCEVVHVDRERQRVTVSRKAVLQKERGSHAGKETGSLTAGTVVHGRVTRVTEYGAFVRFGEGVEGLVHVSDLAWERVRHPDDVVKKGDRLEVQVLRVRGGGKRISLGLKQMSENPFFAFELENHPGDLVAGTAVRLMPFGAFVRVAPGVEGLLHRSEMPIPRHDPVAKHLAIEAEISVRVISVDAELGRLSLSLLHTNGTAIAAEEADGRAALEEAQASPAEGGELSSKLGRLFERAGMRPPNSES